MRQLLIHVGLVSLLAIDASSGTISISQPPSLMQPLYSHRKRRDTQVRKQNIFGDVPLKIGIHSIRGGGNAAATTIYNTMSATTNDSSNLQVQAILIPRQTSLLAPLQFLSFLLINICVNYCMQTAGRPMEDAVRKILNMPSPSEGDGSLLTKVNQLHIYVAKKLLSSSSSSSSVEMLPPAHLPSPLPLLGLMMSIMLYIGTVVVPKWSAHADALLNYQRFDLNDKTSRRDACNVLSNWFETCYDVDPYYEPALKRPSVPALMINDLSTNSKRVICQLFLSPENYNNSFADEKVMKKAKRRGNSSTTTLDHEQNDTQCISTINFLDHPRRYYFELNKKRYYYDPSYQSDIKFSALVSGRPNLHELTTSKLLSDEYTSGLNTVTKLSKARERYGSYSHISIPIPSLKAAFTSRMTSPLVALQLVGRLLSVLEDESIGKSFANLLRLAIQHVSDARQSIAAASTLAKEVKDNEDLGGRDGDLKIWVVRPAKGNGNSNDAEWIKIELSDLLPGDVFTLGNGKSSYFEPAVTMPVDCILLEGTCIMEEAALTGESAPQAKIPLDSTGDTADDGLDMTCHHRSSCIFAGTKLLHGSNDGANDDCTGLLKSLPSLPRTLKPGALFLTLNSGYYSSRGQIVQSLLKSKADLGTVSSRESQLDQMRLICALSLFALGACVYLLMGSESEDTSVFKKVVQCTRIAVASVPSDLPVSLAASARECAAVIREESDVICSNPEAVLFSSKVDCIVFDKTGTLTSDTQSLVSVQYPPQQRNRGTTHKFMSQVILAGANALVSMNESIVGDPLDKACLDYSGWKYDSLSNTATSPDGATLWQLRSFPFNSSKKMSSAIVLVHNDDTYRLYFIVKGTSTVIKGLCVNDGTTEWQNIEVHMLGKMGYRLVSLGSLDVSENAVSSELFPCGLPKLGDSKEVVEKLVHEARIYARNILRDEVECHSSDFTLTGIASFDAPLRASTSRVIRELKQAGMALRMLTGDDASTSISAAAKSGMISAAESQNIYTLKRNEYGSLVVEMNKEEDLTLKMAKRVHRRLKSKDGILVVHGNALQAILFDDQEKKEKKKALKYVRDVLLPKTTLITNAAPYDKYLFVNWLQRVVGKHVLMCGDGVNDIAAMNEADMSCAMMSGFGNDANVADDCVRSERLKRRRIGSNRLASFAADSSHEEQMGIGTTPSAAAHRIQNRINDQLQTNSTQVSSFNVVLSSIAEEVRRYTKLRKGGSGAATILADEDRLRQSLQQKAESASQKTMIKTGEACLASSFTLLRPSITGVETILRVGVAAAARSMFLYRTVAVNCILSCYTLATLYRNGLLYGKWMWQIELMGMICTDRASSAATSMPRPRLVASTRPPLSPFHSAELISTTLQAIIHIVTLSVAVQHGKQLEVVRCNEKTSGPRIKWILNSDGKGSVGAVLASLVQSQAESTLSYRESSMPQQGFVGKSKFQANYVSNNVFFVSVFQNAAMSLVNHPGKPFSIAFLESQPLCLAVGFSFLLCAVCISEAFPFLNKIIQLAPFPNKASKVAMIRVLVMNVALTYFTEYICTFCFRHDIWLQRNKASTPQNHPNGNLCAADQEDELLEEERAQNLYMIYVMFIFGCSLLLPKIML